HTLEEVIVPRAEFHVEAGRKHFISVTFVGRTRHVIQRPRCAASVGPPDLNLGLRGSIAEIDHDQVTLVILYPAPGKKVLEARVVGPARSLAQAPLSFAKHSTINCFEERLIELRQCTIRGLIGSPAQANRQSCFTAFKLPFME